MDYKLLIHKLDTPTLGSSQVILNIYELVDGQSGDRVAGNVDLRYLNLFEAAPEMFALLNDFRIEAERGYTQEEIKNSREWPLIYVRRATALLESIIKWENRNEQI